MPAVVGTALSSLRDSSTTPTQQNPNAWKRTSSPGSDAYADLLSRAGNIEEAIGSRQAGDRGSMSSQYNNASKHRTQYYEDQFRYKDNEPGTVRERVQRESPVMAELKTNVIIKDEFTLVTDLSYHLAQRYTRPDSSIMVKVDHSACIALGGTFDPCYILTITAVPSQMGPSTNKRNAALIQSFMADILSVPQDRGIIKFQPIEECNYAMNGNTVLGEIERLERAKGDESGGPGAIKRMVTSPSRKSVAVPSNKKSNSAIETNVKAPNGTPEGVNSVTPTTPADRKRRSTHAESPGPSAVPHVFELPATESNGRPSTAHGAYAAENGLRMNGISNEDLAASWTPNGRPKTVAGESPHGIRDQMRKEPMPPTQRQSSGGPASSQTKPKSIIAQPNKSNIPTSPKPEMARTSSAFSTVSQKTINGAPARRKDTYLDGVSTSSASRPSERIDPKLDARAAEKNRQMNGSALKDTTANTAKRRSTVVTATPKMPPPPPVPESRPRAPQKRKSFLSAFRRSQA